MVSNFWFFASAPILGQPPSFRPETALYPSRVSGWILDTGGVYILPPLSKPEFTGMKGMKGITAKARVFRLKSKA